MATEDVNPRFIDLDLWPTTEALAAMLEGQVMAVAAIRPQLGAFADAAEQAAARLGPDHESDWPVRLFAEGFDPVLDGAVVVPAMRWELPTPDRLSRARAAGKRLHLVSAPAASGPWHIGGEVVAIRAADGAATSPRGA